MVLLSVVQSGVTKIIGVLNKIISQSAVVIAVCSSSGGCGFEPPARSYAALRMIRYIVG